jgi:hypothetical protein
MPALKGEDAGTKLSARTVESRERKIVWLLCFLAAVHVFIFSAAVPFFNNVDEVIHFDLVYRYSQGEVPRKIEGLSKTGAGYVALMNSHQYSETPEMFPGGQFPPPLWTEPMDALRQDLAAHSAIWQTMANYEVSQPPLYYALAGLWWDLGKGLGFDGGPLLYWLRFLNIPLMATLIWLSYFTARKVFPENVFLRLGVPLLLMFMPQTAFYSITNDALSALCFGATFLCLVIWLRAEKPTRWQGAVTGLAFASAYLAKGTNIPMLAVVIVVVAGKAIQSLRQNKFRPLFPSLAAFAGCGAPPILAWMLWCRSNFGDLTGSKLKIDHFGWTVKPFAEWWHHPIFTPGGLWTYLSGQIGTFWQGEFLWLNRLMSLPGTDAVYTVLSLALLAAALPALLPSHSKDGRQRQALQLSLACFAAGLLFFAWQSVIYDFHDAPNPTREHPYFRAGRMIIGALIPFLLLFIRGLDRALRRFGNTGKWITLTGMIAAMLTLEIVTDWPVFASPFNWFHLP